MKATSKPDAWIWYGFRLPARRSAAAFNALTGNGRPGSTGRGVLAGGAAALIFCFAAATTSHARPLWTTRAPPRVSPSFWPVTVVIPTRSPPDEKTGPPALPRAIPRSSMML